MNSIAADMAAKIQVLENRCSFLGKMNEDLRNKIRVLQIVKDQVDDVLVVLDIVAKDNNYRQALFDLVTANIAIHEHFQHEDQKAIAAIYP